MRLQEIAFFTADVGRMVRFYEQFLGRPAVEPARDGEAAELHVNGVKIFIHKSYDPASFDLPPFNHIAFAVEDVDAACRALAARGLTVEFGPKTGTGGARRTCATRTATGWNCIRQKTYACSARSSYRPRM